MVRPARRLRIHCRGTPACWELRGAFGGAQRNQAANQTWLPPLSRGRGGIRKESKACSAQCTPRRPIGALPARPVPSPDVLLSSLPPPPLLAVRLSLPARAPLARPVAPPHRMHSRPRCSPCPPRAGLRHEQPRGDRGREWTEPGANVGGRQAQGRRGAVRRGGSLAARNLHRGGRLCRRKRVREWRAEPDARAEAVGGDGGAEHAAASRVGERPQREKRRIGHGEAGQHGCLQEGVPPPVAWLPEQWESRPLWHGCLRVGVPPLVAWVPANRGCTARAGVAQHGQLARQVSGRKRRVALECGGLGLGGCGREVLRPDSVAGQKFPGQLQPTQACGAITRREGCGQRSRQTTHGPAMRLLCTGSSCALLLAVL
eukprot:366058-Chlamydomonas_euryale.AAC.2